jgi:ribonuclease P protein component
MNKVNESFPREEGLRGKKNFERVYGDGSVYQTRHIVLFCLKEDVEGRKAAFVTSKKLGKAATRNRIRRRFREAYRKLRAGLPDKIYLVFVGRRGIAELGWEDLLEEMEAVLARAGLGRS